MRAINLSLRGIKGVTLISAGLMVALVSPVVFSRPTHAEGLLPAVKCLVQTLLLSQCQEPAQTNPTPAQPTQAQTAQPSSSASSGTSTRTSNNGGAVTNSPLVSKPVPLETPPQLAEMPNVTLPKTQVPQSSDYVAFFNTSSRYASPQVAGDSTAFIEPTRDGWKIAGLAWYWWATIAVISTGAILYVRRRLVRRLSVLSNH